MERERERDNGFYKMVFGREISFFLFFKDSVESVDTSFFKATVRSDAGQNGQMAIKS